MGVDPDERMIAEVDQEISNGDTHNEARNSTNDSDANVRRGAILRTSIAIRMWNDYVSHDQTRMLMCIFLYGIVSNVMTVAEHLPIVAFIQLLCVPY